MCAGSGRPVCDHCGVAFWNRGRTCGCERHPCDDCACRIVLGLPSNTIRIDWWRPVDQVHPLSGSHGLFIERWSNHWPWPVAETPWSAKKYSSLAGADLSCSLEMAECHCRTYRDLGDALGPKDHSEVSRGDPWPLRRYACLSRSVSYFSGTFGFTQQRARDWTTPIRWLRV